MPLVNCLRRVSIVVANLDRSLRLYRDTLGLRETWSTFVSAKEHDHAVFKLLGIAPVDVRAAFLQSDDPAASMIGLIEIGDPKMQATPLAEPGKRRGELSLIFHTDQINELYHTMVNGQFTIISPPTLNELPGYVPSMEMTLRDPDGVFINFIQPVKDAPPGR
jgi:catechol 2,3-dioxygenase-like lactoylglutathione lyase family enzyme